MTVWTHRKASIPTVRASRKCCGLPPANVRCIHVEGSGCYGHNGADDAAADAALIARAMPGTPVRVQWIAPSRNTSGSRFGPAMMTKLKASLDGDGKIADWNFEVWSNTHSMRPGGAGCMLAAQHMAQPFAVPCRKTAAAAGGGGDRNAIPIYTFPSAHVVHHFHSDMPLRISAMRSLGAYHNVFSIESFMDELAALAGGRSGRVQAQASRRPPRPRRDCEGGRRGSAGARTRKRRGTAVTLRLRALQESRGLLARSQARSR